MSGKWNLIVDVAACSNCGNCTLAIKDEYVGNAFPGVSAEQPAKGHKWFWVDRIVRGSGSKVDVAYVPKSCNHCDDPPCRKVAPDVVMKRDDGIVIFNPEKSVGRRELVDACPYGAVAWNEEANIPQIWPFDAHLLDAGWKDPRCVQVCPTGSLSAVRASDDDMAKRVAEDELVVLKPELGTRPRVYYRNVWRAEQQFVAGNVIGRDKAGRVINLPDVQVTIVLDDVEKRTVRSDAFGDFKVDRVRPGQRFRLTIAVGRACRAQRAGVVHESIDLGSIEVTDRPEADERQSAQ